MDLEQTQAKFETTNWSLVSGLKSESPQTRQAALATLTETYWPSVYGYLRRRGWAREEAAEATQAFFADVVLWRGLFDRVDPERGRLRTLVLAALRNFLADLGRRSGRRRPTGSTGASELDRAKLDRVEGDLADASDRSPEAAFSHEWAAAVLQEANRRCERHFLDKGKPAHWRAFEARVLRPAITTVDPPPLQALAAELGFATAAEAAAAVQVVKKRLFVLLREVAAETASSPADADDEYRWIIEQLA